MIHSKRSFEGYLLIDHSNSPGLTIEQMPPELLKKYGPPAVVGKGQTYESATAMCCHCQRIVILNPLRTRPRNWCGKCGDYVCDNGGCITTCKPFSQVVDEIIEVAHKDTNVKEL